MAKVHKAHKSSTKYSFQKKHLSVKTWLIILAVIVVAAIGLKIGYDHYVEGEFDVATPDVKQLNTIAANFDNMILDTEKFAPDYAYYYYYNMLIYNYTSENGYHVQITPPSAEANLESTEAEAMGGFYRTRLSDAINGVAPWGQKTTYISVGGENIGVTVFSTETDVTDEIMAEVLSELEVLALTPVEVPAETVDETPTVEGETEETPSVEGETENTPAE